MSFSTEEVALYTAFGALMLVALYASAKALKSDSKDKFNHIEFEADSEAPVPK